MEIQIVARVKNSPLSIVVGLLPYTDGYGYSLFAVYRSEQARRAESK
jgi:hypothetical protein